MFDKDSHKNRKTAITAEKYAQFFQNCATYFYVTACKFY